MSWEKGEELEGKVPTWKQLRCLQNVGAETPLPSAPEGLPSRMDIVHYLNGSEKGHKPCNGKEELELKEQQ